MALPREALISLATTSPHIFLQSGHDDSGTRLGNRQRVASADIRGSSCNDGGGAVEASLFFDRHAASSFSSSCHTSLSRLLPADPGVYRKCHDPQRRIYSASSLAKEGTEEDKMRRVGQTAPRKQH